MIQTIVVFGGTASERELAIKNKMAAVLQNSQRNKKQSDIPFKWAILLEGLSDGKPVLSESEHIIVARIAAGCICCSNQLIMRIYLNRLIQQNPEYLFLSLSIPIHLEQIKQYMCTPNYQTRLEFAADINLQTSLHS